MDQRQFEAIGDRLRSLGHSRREVVQSILTDANQGESGEARRHYEELDRISEQAIQLMQEQRALIADRLRVGRL